MSRKQTFEGKLVVFCRGGGIGWRGSMVAQVVKNLPAMQKIRVRSLGGEDLLEKGMATHSSILAWRIPWTKGGLQATVHRVAKSQT